MSFAEMVAVSGALTVTLMVFSAAVNLPSTAATDRVTVVLPAATPVTSPAEDTVATAELAEA